MDLIETTTIGRYEKEMNIIADSEKEDWQRHVASTGWKDKIYFLIRLYPKTKQTIFNYYVQKP